MRGFGFVLAAFASVFVVSCSPALAPNTVVISASELNVSGTESSATISSSTLAVGATATITVTLKDTLGDPYLFSLPSVALNVMGGTSAGTTSAFLPSAPGVMTATFTAGTAGTPVTLIVSLNGAALESAPISLQVTP